MSGVDADETAALANCAECDMPLAKDGGCYYPYCSAPQKPAAILTKHLPAPVSDGLVERFLTDGQRMLWRDDVEGICPTPDNCFEYGDRVRCGPCARRQAEACGIATYEGAPNLPEVARLKREVAQLEARIEKLTGALFNATALISHRMPMNATALVAGETLIAGEVWQAGVAALNEKD